MAFSAPNNDKLVDASWLISAATYSASLFLLLSPLLLNILEPKWDAINQFLPSFIFLADSVHESGLPLWDPYTNCGYPFHAEPQNFTLNPLAIILGLIFSRPSLGFIWFWSLNWWWGGLGMLWLARHFNALPAGAFAAAIAYALSGFFVGHAEHTSYIITAAWLPWILTSLDRAVLRSDVAFAILAGAALGACSFGGYPGMILFSCFAMGIWLTLRFVPTSNLEQGDQRSLSTRTLWIASSLAMAAVILIAVWSPILHAFFVEGGGYTDRTGPLPPDRANFGDPFTFFAAVSVFFPYFTVVGKSYMGADISMTNAYVGILTVPFAIFWAWRVGFRRSWWLLAFALFMFAVSLGGNFGLRTLLYYLFPPLRYMRFSAPFRLFWMLAVCLAAGLGISRFLRYPEERHLMLRTLLCWSAAAGSVALLFAGVSVRHEMLFMDVAHRIFLPGIAILAAGLLFMRILTKERGGRVEMLAPVILSLLVLLDMSVHLYNNAATVWNKRDITRTLDAGHVRSTVVNGDPGARLPGKPFGPVNAQQVSKVPLVQGYMTMLSKGFDEILCNSRFVEIMSGPNRFWLSPNVQPLPSYDKALAALSAAGAESVVPVFVESPPMRASGAGVVPGTFGSVRIRSYGREQVDIQVEAPGEKGAILASTERYAAGWTVKVDGLPRRVQKVNLFFRGVFVPPGRHDVTWRYEPEFWPTLVAVSYIVLLGVSALALVMIWRKKRSGLADRS